VQDLCVSIVSHGQCDLVFPLLRQLDNLVSRVKNVVLTLNVPELTIPNPYDYGFKLDLIENTAPKGFAYNHNQNFARCSSRFFCVMNPDIRILKELFDTIILTMEGYKQALVATVIVDTFGNVEDSARVELAPRALLERQLAGLGKRLGLTFPDGRFYVVGDQLNRPDWIAGMFMLFSSDVYRIIEGLDSSYHLYCEDAEICRRLRHLGFDFALDGSVSVVHDARRRSRRSLRHFNWHVRSLLRYWLVNSTSTSDIKINRGSL